MDKLIAWVRQPTTLQGLALIVCAVVGDYFGTLSLSLAVTMASGALLLLLIPDNTSLRSQALAGLSVGLQEIARHGAVVATAAATGAVVAATTTETSSHE